MTGQEPVEIAWWRLWGDRDSTTWTLRAYAADRRKIGKVVWTAEVVKWIYVEPWARRQGHADTIWDEAVERAEAMGLPPLVATTDWTKLTPLGKKWALAVDPPGTWETQAKAARLARFSNTWGDRPLPHIPREARQPGLPFAERYELIKAANPLRSRSRP